MQNKANLLNAQMTAKATGSVKNPPANLTDTLFYDKIWFSLAIWAYKHILLSFAKTKTKIKVKGK
jgi:hypothetical protein